MQQSGRVSAHEWVVMMQGHNGYIVKTPIGNGWSLNAVQ